jgi:hypothetical protein
MGVKGLKLDDRYLIVGHEKGKNTKYHITCKNCSSDVELYGKYFTVSRPQLKSLNGELFCGCKEGYRYSEEQNKVLVDRKSSQLRMEHIFTEEVKASSKIKYRCLCKGNDYKSCTVRSFLKKKGNGCKYCERGDKSCMGKCLTS